jgi:hypothetical protein
MNQRCRTPWAALTPRGRRALAMIVMVTALAASAPSMATATAAAQEATPAASPAAPADLANLAVLDERVGAIPPEELLEALLDTPVAPDLFPPEFADVRTEPWIDESDTDLDDVVGGVFVTSGDTLLGVYIVHPSEESATTRFENLLIEEATPFEVDQPTLPERVSVAGRPAWLINTDEIDGTSLVTLRVENVIVAGAVDPGFATPVPDRAATPVSAAETLAVTEAVVNHLARVAGSN